jgi:hypothetical protein
MTKKKQRPQQRERKLAFDRVMQSYRGAKDTGVGASNWSDSVATSKNPARPNLTEFRADVEQVIESIITDYESLLYFYTTYIKFDDEDELNREIFAEKMLGVKRIAWEQKVGSEFLKRSIFPLKGYFNSIRRSRFETV